MWSRQVLKRYLTSTTIKGYLNHSRIVHTVPIYPRVYFVRHDPIKELQRGCIAPAPGLLLLADTSTTCSRPALARQISTLFASSKKLIINYLSVIRWVETSSPSSSSIGSAYFFCHAVVSICVCCTHVFCCCVCPCSDSLLFCRSFSSHRCLCTIITWRAIKWLNKLMTISFAIHRHHTPTHAPFLSILILALSALVTVVLLAEHTRHTSG